ncbi:MAG: TIGR02679 family protein [Streptosporangiaceae bacterium]|nr:TIGR02679 family protein [Streptosporangiaceae bacterium]
MPNPYRGSEYRRLLAAARRSLERTGGDLGASVSVSGPDDAERRAIIGITGQYRSAGTARVTVRLADLDRAVREVTGQRLPELLAELGGPLRDLPARRSAHAAVRETTLRLAEKSSLHATCGWYRDWLDEITRDGTLTRLVNQGEQERLAQAVRVLEHLPGRGEPGGPAGVPVMLPALAADTTGDTKALNHGTVLSTLVLRALAARTGARRPENAEDRRDLWYDSGVVVDDLASRVLVLNLPAGGSALGEWLTGAARCGVPFYVTLHQLVTLAPAVRGALVHMCENPAVLRRAAGELGPGSAPLLCTEGRPSTAFQQLAGIILEGGGELRYHGDFDWPGIAIAGSVLRRHSAPGHGARPWRMSAADYLSGVPEDAAHVRLAGPPQPTPWDPELAEVMAATGRAVYEETVAGVLIGDLRAPPGGGAGPLAHLAPRWGRRPTAGVLPVGMQGGLRSMRLVTRVPRAGPAAHRGTGNSARNSAIAKYFDIARHLSLTFDNYRS